MNKWFWGLLLATTTLLAMAGCVGKDLVEGTALPTAPGKVDSFKSASVQTTGDNRFTKILAAARNEGRIVAHSALASGPRQALADAMREKYGLEMEFVNGSGSELIVKAEAERRGGIYAGDVVLSGTGAQIMYKEKGFLEPMGDLLVLPEVKDAKQWMEGKLPFVDKEKTMIVYFSHAGSSLVINPNLVKVEEMQSYRDLLSPKWKEKILMQDPTVSGAGSLFFAINLIEIMGKEFTMQLTQQKPVLMKDSRLALEWVARGKYPILLAPATTTLGELTQAGAPLKHIVPIEGTYSGGGSGGLSLVNRAAHPNAATIFMNWLLSREGQTVIAKAQPDQSRRLDVPTDFIDPDRRLNPDVKYIDSETEEHVLGRVEMMKLAKEMFNP